MNRNLISRKIVVDEEATPLIDREFFHQSGADAHGHGADDLTARRFRIEYPSGGADGEHPAHANFRRRGIDAELDEMRAKRRLLMRLVEIAIFDQVFRDQFAV